MSNISQENKKLNIIIDNNGSLLIDGYKSPWNNRELWCSLNCDIGFVKKILGNDINTIIEFGSYDGGDGIKYKYHFPNANVYSIEPSPTCYKHIKSLEKYGIKVFNYAISDENSILDFYETFDLNNNNYAPCGSLNKSLCSTTTGPSAKDLKVLDPIKVEAKTLETFCNEQNINKIDLLHIDVEGYSIQAIKGMGNIEARLIYVEVCSETHNHSNDIKIILENKNYKKLGSIGCDEFWVLKS